MNVLRLASELATRVEPDSIRAGCQACFLRRPEQVLDEITPTPTLIVSDLRELAAQAVQLQTAA